MKVNAKILEHNTAVQKVLAFTVLEAIDIMHKATFRMIPEKIILHLITNDVEYSSPAEIEKRVRELLDLIRAECPAAKIFFSSVLVRRDLMDNVDQVNDILWDFSSVSLMTIIDHDNIDSELLKDF